MKTADLGDTYAGRLAMAFAMALSGYDDLFDTPRPKRDDRERRIKRLLKQFKAADAHAIETLNESDDEAEIDAAYAKRNRIWSKLEAEGVHPFRDAELWQ